MRRSSFCGGGGAGMSVSEGCCWCWPSKKTASAASESELLLSDEGSLSHHACIVAPDSSLTRFLLVRETRRDCGACAGRAVLSRRAFCVYWPRSSSIILLTMNAKFKLCLLIAFWAAPSCRRLPLASAAMYLCARARAASWTA